MVQVKSKKWTEEQILAMTDDQYQDLLRYARQWGEPQETQWVADLEAVRNPAPDPTPKAAKKDAKEAAE
jgi:hypothetical protein